MAHPTRTYPRAAAPRRGRLRSGVPAVLLAAALGAVATAPAQAAVVGGTDSSTLRDGRSYADVSTSWSHSLVRVTARADLFDAVKDRKAARVEVHARSGATLVHVATLTSAPADEGLRETRRAATVTVSGRAVHEIRYSFYSSPQDTTATTVTHRR